MSNLFGEAPSLALPLKGEGMFFSIPMNNELVAWKKAKLPNGQSLKQLTPSPFRGRAREGVIQ